MTKTFDTANLRTLEIAELTQRIIDALMDEAISPKLRDEMRQLIIANVTEEQLGEAFTRYGEEYSPAYGLSLEGDALNSYNIVAQRLGLKQVAKSGTSSIDSNPTHRSEREPKPLRTPRRFTIRWRIAAALLSVATIVGGYIFMVNDKNDGNDKNDKRQEFIIANTSDQQDILLPDSTRIVVESGCSAIYHETDSTRMVALSGDAFFAVKKDTLKPFIVSTSDLQLSVLGTEFRVSEVPPTVSLFEGSVAVEAGAESKTLSWGERLIYDPTTGVVDVSIISAKEMMAEGYKPRLIFDHATLGEVLDALAFTFDTDIATTAGVDTTAGELTLHAEDMTLTEILELLTKISHEDLSFSSVNGTIEITRTD